MQAVEPFLLSKERIRICLGVRQSLTTTAGTQNMGQRVYQKGDRLRRRKKQGFKLALPWCIAFGPCSLRVAGSHPPTVVRRVGQNHIRTVYIRYFWQGNHRIYGHIRCIYTVLVNPSNVSALLLGSNGLCPLDCCFRCRHPLLLMSLKVARKFNKIKGPFIPFHHLRMNFKMASECNNITIPQSCKQPLSPIILSSPPL